MHLIDLHCDTLLECYKNKCGLRENSCHINLNSMKASDAMVQFFAAYLPEGEDAAEEGVTLKPYDLFYAMKELYDCELVKNNDLIKPVLSYRDVEKNIAEKKMSGVLTIEDGNLLEGKIQRLDQLYEAGVRLITLLWNHENCLGYPHSKDEGEHKRGLKDFGIEVVKRMNELGIIIDVSHLSEGGFYDVAKYSKRPFVASHSCARALCSHSRNLTDDQLKCLAEAGGVVGVNYNAGFLRDGASYSSIADILAHIEHMIQVIGSDFVALGSDFDGIDCELEIDGYSQYGKLVKALSETYSDEVVEKICYKNALRIMKECL